MICDDSSCSSLGGKPLCFGFEVLKDPSSCINHLLIILLDVLLLIMLTFVIIQKSLLRPIQGQNRMEKCSKLQLVSAITSGSLGLLHLCSGIWVLDDKLRKNLTVFPLSLWLLELLHRFTWMLVGLSVLKQLARTWLRPFSILMFFVSSILCAFSLSYAFKSKELSHKATLDVLSFLGAFLLLFGSLYTPLDSQVHDKDLISHISVTPFEKAGAFVGCH